MTTQTHHRFNQASVLLALTTLLSCSKGVAPNSDAPRSYRLGFSATPPKLTIESVLATIDAWRSRANVAQITQSVPWRALLADTTAAVLVRRDQKELVALYRSRGLPLIIQLDVTDGLDRHAEAPELVALGRSIAEPSVQQVYREYVAAVDSILHPEYLGLAMETNLVRAIAPASLYAAVKAIAVLGVPIDYYARIVESGATRLPMLVVEGGWSSGVVTGMTSSPDKQARWIKRQMELADRAARPRRRHLESQARARPVGQRLREAAADVVSA